MRHRSLGYLPLTVVLLAAAVVCLPASASARRYSLGDDSEVSFVARITGSSFVAKSTALKGTVDYDEKAGAVTAGDITVQADSFDTGMSMRNGHMRDKYLEAKKFPVIRFKAGAGKAAAREGAEATLAGSFVIKGVEKPVKVGVKVDSVSEQVLTVVAKFQLNITDFGIPQPSFTVVKMDPLIDVTVKLHLHAE